ncbi:MAG: DUF1990 domain-containing protein [Armatimonadetes bacterium]|nr:DUF1990 domain-containing protein [Armatimonadota bacterium]
MGRQRGQSTEALDEELQVNESIPAADVGQEVVPATDGAGPLLQRDYWAVIEGTRCTPEELFRLVVEDFPAFAPGEIACFNYFPDGSAGPLDLDMEMAIEIRHAGICHVRVVHKDDRSLTLRTLDGHPEAGRITFGAYYDRTGRLKFRIRSRARSSDPLRYVGYQLFGKGMQTLTWVTFVERVAKASGGWIHGEVHVETNEVTDTLADQGELDTPTFVAKDREEE